MKKIIPDKIARGSKARVISPSRSISIISDENIKIAESRLNSLGLDVTYGEFAFSIDNCEYQHASIVERVSDIHDAFEDKEVKMILTAIGGYNVNQLLDYIDYNLIKNNPKILCGFSDITALANAIYAQTGMVTYSGPHFSSFGMLKGFEYTEEYFRKMLFCDEPVTIVSSKRWSNDQWFSEQDKRTFICNEGMKVINKGVAEGVIIGGNLCTLNLLQGTKYMPSGEKYVLFIEDDGLITSDFFREFDRNLQSLIHCIGKENINGIVVGRAETACNMNCDRWKEIFSTKKELEDIPIVIDADFGHTTPIFTFPIGGIARLEVTDDIKITIDAKR